MGKRLPKRRVEPMTEKIKIFEKHIKAMLSFGKSREMVGEG